MREILLVIGRGIGQVMFQNNAFSGLLMLVGIALNSWILALLAFGGNIVSTLAAWLSGYSHDDIRNGLYGFNGTLVGIAVGVFLELNLMSVLLLVITAWLSTWITYILKKQDKLPGFTAPFIISVWILLAVCRYFLSSLLLQEPTADEVQNSFDLFRAFSFHIGQVMFQGDNLFTGLFFLLGILVNSPLNAVYAVLGALLPLGMYWFTGEDYSVLNAGIFGYNAVLCAIALGDCSWRGFLWSVLSVLLSVVLQIAGMRVGITTLTAPFVLSVWIVMGMRQLIKSPK